jgi:DNA-binding LacI/PurR family transcriptional regulator
VHDSLQPVGAVDLLLAQIEGRNLREREIALPVELKIRESTARRS